MAITLFPAWLQRVEKAAAASRQCKPEAKNSRGFPSAPSPAQQLTWPGPTYRQVALLWQPPLLGSRQGLISTHSRPLPVQPGWHMQRCPCGGPVLTHLACGGKTKSQTPEPCDPATRSGSLKGARGRFRKCVCAECGRKGGWVYLQACW